MSRQPRVPVGIFDSPCLRLPLHFGSLTFKFLSLLTALASVAASAGVTNYVWDGNGGAGNANWNTLLNWNSTNTVPPANALGGLTNTVITFAGTAKLAPAMNNSYFINSLIFGNDAGAFTLNSSGANRILTIGSGGISNFSTNKETVVSSLSLSNAQTWNASAGDLAIRGTVNLGANALTVAGLRNVAISNVIRGTGAIIKQDAGTLTLAGGGANTYSGGTTLNGGNIAVAKANALGTGPLTINAGSLNIAGFNQTVGTVSLFGGSISGTSGQLSGSSFQVQSGTISARLAGTGALIKSSNGTVTLAGGGGANTYSGGTILNGGTINAAKVNALGTGPLTLNAGNLNIAGFNQTVGTVSLLGGSISGTSGLLNGLSYQLQSGTISARLGGTGALIKSGGGTVNLTSSNTYSGGTVINGGTLMVNNVLGSGTGTGRVSINNGGMLMGSGIISGAVTNRAGGTISAGSGVGLFRTGAEFWLGGSTNRWEISDAGSSAGVGWDLLNITGALSISATSSNKAFIDVVSLTLAGLPGAASSFNPMQNYTWTIAQTTTGIAFAPGQSASTVFDLLTGGFVNSSSGGTFSVGTASGGKDLNLIYTVPEPEKWMFLVMGIFGYLYGRKWSR